jgi:hypothetical protein
MRETGTIADYRQNFASNKKAFTTTSTWISCLYISEKERQLCMEVRDTMIDAITNRSV